jgi:hypothetical protein
MAKTAAGGVQEEATLCGGGRERRAQFEYVGTHSGGAAAGAAGSAPRVESARGIGADDCGGG